MASSADVDASVHGSFAKLFSTHELFYTEVTTKTAQGVDVWFASFGPAVEKELDADKTYMRTAIAFEMGHASRLSWTPSSRFATLTLNGVDKGLYQITEKVEVSTNRVDLESDEPFGFLLEIDTIRGDMEWDSEEHPTDWLGSNWGSKWIIKDPELDPEKRDEMAHVNALREFMSSFETALEAQNWTAVSSMIDVDSFVAEDDLVLPLMHYSTCETNALCSTWTATCS